MGALHSVHDELERYFYDTDNREILTSDGKPFLELMGAGELARAPKKSCFR